MSSSTPMVFGGRAEMASKAMRRTAFDGDVAPKLAAQIGALPELHGVPRRFSFFGDEKHLLVVAGKQEAEYVQLALVYGLSFRGARKLTLVLPRGHCLATQQRVPWLKADAQPTLFVHDGTSMEELS